MDKQKELQQQYYIFIPPRQFSGIYDCITVYKTRHCELATTSHLFIISFSEKTQQSDAFFSLQSHQSAFSIEAE